MIFYSFFKTLVGKEVTVELKNDLSITGVLHSVDQYLNIKLTEISVGEPERHPQASFFFPLLFPLLAFSLSSRVCSQRRVQSQKHEQTNEQLATVKNVFIRGSVVRYVKVSKKEVLSFEFLLFSSSPTSRPLPLVFLALTLFSSLSTHFQTYARQLPTDGVDTELLHDATRREARGQ